MQLQVLVAYTSNHHWLPQTRQAEFWPVRGATDQSLGDGIWWAALQTVSRQTIGWCADGWAGGKKYIDTNFPWTQWDFSGGQSTWRTPNCQCLCRIKIYVPLLHSQCSVLSKVALKEDQLRACAAIIETLWVTTTMEVTNLCPAKGSLRIGCWGRCSGDGVMVWFESDLENWRRWRLGMAKGRCNVGLRIQWCPYHEIRVAVLNPGAGATQEQQLLPYPTWLPDVEGDRCQSWEMLGGFTVGSLPDKFGIKSSKRDLGLSMFVQKWGCTGISSQTATSKFYRQTDGTSNQLNPIDLVLCLPSQFKQILI